MDGQDLISESLIPEHTRQASKALLLLLFYSTLMFTLPFGAFFGTKYCLKDHFHVVGFENTVGAVLAAVITVNLIIVMYAYQAFHEQEYDDQGNEIKSDLKED